MIIDGHAHMGGEYRDVESILSTLDRAGVDKVILCPSDSQRNRSLWIPHLTGRIGGENINLVVNRFLRIAASAGKIQSSIDRGNEEVYRVASSCPDRVIQFIWANPLARNCIDDLVHKLELWKFPGIKLHQCSHPFAILSPEFRNIAEFARENGLPVFIHLYSRKEISDFIKLSKDLKTIFIIGHIIGLETYIENKADLSDSVFFDISCPPLVSKKRIQKAFNVFGAERLVMGSDTPFGINNTAEMISRIRSLPILQQEMDKILGGNMKNILGI